MSLLTRCPACTTVFRVTEWQLDARQGFVRCGQCAKVFDARASLVPESQETPPAATTEPVELPAEAALPPETAPQAEAAPAPAPGAIAEEPARAIDDAAAEPEKPSPPFDFGPQHRSRSRRAAVLWGLGSVLLLAGLAAQAAYWFRTEIVAARPATQPYLAAACRALGCDIPPPRDVQLLSIESSELQVDKNLPGLLTLNATLRNRAPFAQTHPSIELTLTDADDRPLARRVLAPEDYLGERLAREPLFAGASEHPVRLHIDATAVRPTGYRLFLFHP